MKDLAFKLKAIADETRLTILIMLLQKKYCVRAMAKKLKISDSAVSQHLKVLREVGLVIGEKRSYWVHYSVQEGVLEEIADQIKSLKFNQSLKCERNGRCKTKELTTGEGI